MPSDAKPYPRYEPSPASKIDEALQRARTCYDHLAGRLGVALADALIERRHVILTDDGGTLTESGQRFLTGLGLDIARSQPDRRRFCRPCLDWSERRHHIAGAVGIARDTHLFENGWVKRSKDSRAVAITPQGRAGLAETFGVTGF